MAVLAFSGVWVGVVQQLTVVFELLVGPAFAVQLKFCNGKDG
jgi:hypothetical protein